MRPGETSGSVLLLTPEGRDAEVASAILREVSMRSVTCAGLNDLPPILSEADCAVIAEEALARGDRKALAEWIRSQPPWSDFPFILLSSRGRAADARFTELLGNVTLLERPFHPSVLVSAVQSAARARRRQREAEAYLKERKLAEEQKELLIRELHHRVKNFFAKINALLRASARSANSVEEFTKGFSDRIYSMSKTHSLLLEGGGRTAGLRDLLWSELGPFQDPTAERIKFHGPPLELPPELALPMGMAIHELVTNAVKYGSLSLPQGHLDIDWGVHTGATGSCLKLVWQERDGPAVSAPLRQGFGSTLIERTLGVQCKAKLQTEFPPCGFRLHLELPLSGARNSAQELTDKPTGEFATTA